VKWKFDADDAIAIAEKLGANRLIDRKRHENVQFRYNDRIIFTFGIRRGSGEKGHNFIPRQMSLSQKECRTFRDCTMSLEQYIQILRGKGLIVD
jgi:hypothetical protein